MHVRALLTDSRAVSPVVKFALGVGVALAVVTAAVVAFGGVWSAFACPLVGGCEDPTAPPTLEGTVDPGTDGWGTGDETVTVVHRGEETLAVARLSLRVGEDTVTDVAWPDGNRWNRGERATYEGSVPAGADVHVVWTSADGEQAQVLAAWTAGSAPTATDADERTTNHHS
ncbi:hypothetical protein [Halorubellus litoreus]|uniref:Archaeal Type IV pilin N-terminal domain-containing protein n=1 Tax=Halorubellus litoreus TaxID=755308 RepID=A0ABD5V9I1_9EURY